MFNYCQTKTIFTLQNNILSGVKKVSIFFYLLRQKSQKRCILIYKLIKKNYINILAQPVVIFFLRLDCVLNKVYKS